MTLKLVLFRWAEQWLAHCTIECQRQKGAQYFEHVSKPMIGVEDRDIANEACDTDRCVGISSHGTDE